MLTTPIGRRAGAVALLLAALAAGCSESHTSASSGPPAGTQAPTTDATPAARISITPARGQWRVKPNSPITVEVTDGTLRRVKVWGGGGPVPGRLIHNGTAWRSTDGMSTSTTYTVHASATNSEGKRTKASSRFHTLTPATVETMQIFEGSGETYGVGMPIMLTFSEPVENKRGVERALSIRSSKPVVGAWYWDSDTSVQFRPRRYWPAHTSVTFTGRLDGVEVAPGVYGTHNLQQQFTIGDSVIAVGSTADHHIQIYRNGHLFANWPMSSGKPGDDTPNGTYLTIEKGNPVEMKGPGYDIMVPWSVRFTWSGDYLHDAFWSVGEQGFSNVSHGCVNLSPADAETYYGHGRARQPGDDHRQPARGSLRQRLDDLVPQLARAGDRQRDAPGGARGAARQHVRRSAHGRQARRPAAAAGA